MTMAQIMALIDAEMPKDQKASAEPSGSMTDLLAFGSGRYSPSG